MKREKKSRSTAAQDDGVNYRDIAECMTELGYPMNHSSARNHVLRVMCKFVQAISRDHGIRMSDEQAFKIAKEPQFQHAMHDLLQDLETIRRQSVSRP